MTDPLQRAQLVIESALDALSPDDRLTVIRAALAELDQDVEPPKAWTNHLGGVEPNPAHAAWENRERERRALTGGDA